MGKNLNVVFIRINSVADEIIPPLHYGYLAASLPRSCNVSLIDMLRDNMDEECLLKKITSNRFDLICLSGYSKDIVPIRNLSGKLKTHSPESIYCVWRCSVQFDAGSYYGVCGTWCRFLFYR